MQRQLLFTNQQVSYTFIDCDSYIHVIGDIKKHALKSVTVIYHWQNESIKTTLDKSILLPFNLAYLFTDTIDKDHFIDGYIAYISLFFLLEKTQFSHYLPFQFSIPCQLSQGDCADYHILQYMYSALKFMLKLTDHLTYHYLNTITYFIETYKHLFHAGPPLNSGLINELSLIMLNLTLEKKSISCHHCHNKYKNGAVKCLICHDYVIDSGTSILCAYCHHYYNPCNHQINSDKSASMSDMTLDITKDIKLIHEKLNDKTDISDISNITEDIKDIKNKLEMITKQLTEQNSRSNRHKHKKTIQVYQGSNY